MNEERTPAEEPTSARRDEPLSPDNLVHMYGGFLFFVAVPVILVLLIGYFFFVR